MSLSLVRFLLGALLSAVLLVSPASGGDVAAIDPQSQVGTAGWRVDGVAGVATVRRATGGVARVAVGHVITVGSDLETGPGTVVFLSRDDDRLVIQPNTRLRVAEPEPRGLLDRFIQSLGSVFYDVEPRRNRSFGVTAPYVAAVVKGTRFSVAVAADQASVQVEEGKVEVRSADGTSTVLLERGQKATARPSDSRGLRVSTVQAPETADAPAAKPATDAMIDATGDDAGVDTIDSDVDDAADAGGALDSASASIGDGLDTDSDGESEGTDSDSSGSGESGDGSDDGSGSDNSGSGSENSGSDD
jgi:hypothetical protein